MVIVRIACLLPLLTAIASAAPPPGPSPATAIATAASAAPAQVSGPALTLIQQRCSGCHTPQTPLGQRRTPEDWEATVQTMVDRGAELSPDEIGIVVAYLAKNNAPASAR